MEKGTVLERGKNLAERGLVRERVLIRDRGRA